MRYSKGLTLLAALFLSAQALAGQPSEEAAKAASGRVVGENAGLSALSGPSAVPLKNGPAASIRKLLSGANPDRWRNKDVPAPIPQIKGSRSPRKDWKDIKKGFSALADKIHAALLPAEEFIERHEGAIWAFGAMASVGGLFLPTTTGRVIQGVGTSALFLNEAHVRHRKWHAHKEENSKSRAPHDGNPHESR